MTGLTALALGLRLEGESVDDPLLSYLYGDHSLSGELTASADLPHSLRFGFVAGYRRLGGRLVDEDGGLSESTSWVRYTPFAATVGLHLEVGRVDLGAGLGPATVGFAEQVGQGDASTSRGWKWGGLVEAAARVRVGELQASNTSISLEGSVGYRLMLRRHGAVCGDEPVCGLDFSAIRVGLGVVAMF